MCDVDAYVYACAYTSWIIVESIWGMMFQIKETMGASTVPFFFMLLKSTYLHFIVAVAMVKFLTNLIHQSFMAIAHR